MQEGMRGESGGECDNKREGGEQKIDENAGEKKKKAGEK